MNLVYLQKSARSLLDLLVFAFLTITDFILLLIIRTLFHLHEEDLFNNIQQYRLNYYCCLRVQMNYVCVFYICYIMFSITTAFSPLSSPITGPFLLSRKFFSRKHYRSIILSRTRINKHLKSCTSNPNYAFI